MAGNNSPIFPGTMQNYRARIQNSDGTTAVTLVTGPTNGTKVESIAATSDDTAAVVVQLIATVSAVDHVLGEVTIPIAAGTNGTTKAVNLLNTTDLPWLRSDEAGRPYLYVASGTTLKVRPKTTVTAAKYINLFAQAGDF
jgi:hypothetical protein